MAGKDFVLLDPAVVKGEHMPKLVLTLKIPRAVGRSSPELMPAAEGRLPAN
jgi:hypothetical protein